jgi:hypothetical protein
VKVNRFESIGVNGILAAPPAPIPPRFTAAPPCVLKKLITVKLENPVPLTVIIDPV